MFYLGEYDEDEAADIRSFLSDAGIRVELKPYLEMDSAEKSYLYGRYSRLKELAEDISDFENYLSLIKSALSQSSSKEEFDEILLRELDPEMMNKRDRILALCESDEENSGEEHSEESPLESSEDTSEEDESLDFSSEDWLSFLLSSERAQSFAQSVLSLNGIVAGEPIGDKLDDPLLEIPVDPDDYDPETDELKLKVESFLSRSTGVYVDEFTTSLAGEIDEEFSDLYPVEFQQISSLEMLIEKLATPPSEKKMSLDEFYDRCILSVDKDDISLIVDGRDVFMELIRVLEKGDLLKAKGDKIKWKG